MQHRRAKIGLAFLTLVCLTGCYERVVGAKGMGAQGVSVSQSNLPEDSRSSTTTQKKTVKLRDLQSR